MAMAGLAARLKMDSVADSCLEQGSAMRAFGLFFASVPDPRAGNAQHDLSEVLFIAFVAVLCGAESCAEMAEFGYAKEAALREVLCLGHGIPSHDTFSRIFRRLDPVAFEAAFRRFMAAFAAQLSGLAATTTGQVIALDGKSLRGAFETGARATPLHLVTAWAADQRLVLGQRRAPGRNEIQGALELVSLLDLDGSIVTADALHGNRKMAAAVRTRGGDYVLALKANRGPLYTHTEALFADAQPGESASTAEIGHGRSEERRATVLPIPADVAQQFRFPGLAAVARIEGVRRIGADEDRQSRYFVLSRLYPPAEVLRIVRAYWSIENGQHWLLDVVFDEDRARSRKDNAGENLALLRRLALNLLKADTYKASIRRKIKRAGWEDAYLLSLLSQMR
jgi:predicted transposase YbfD/YdcC